MLFLTTPWIFFTFFKLYNGTKSRNAPHQCIYLFVNQFICSFIHSIVYSLLLASSSVLHYFQLYSPPGQSVFTSCFYWFHSSTSSTCLPVISTCYYSFTSRFYSFLLDYQSFLLVSASLLIVSTRSPVASTCLQVVYRSFVPVYQSFLLASTRIPVISRVSKLTSGV